MSLHTYESFTKLNLGTVLISLIHSPIHQLCDKALSYLKDVIGTPAVYKVLYRLNPIFNALHWAGLTDYTTHF